MDNWNLLKQKAEEFNIELTDKQLEQFREYSKFLYAYNSHTNLVSDAEETTVVRKHFIDSLAIGLYKDFLGWNSKKSLIDIGIGGGFPGVPIIIANSEWTLCAVDSVGKKTKFIELLSKEIGLEERIKIINARSEDLAVNAEYREKFDCAAARAVSRMNTLLEYTVPFIKKDGHFIAYKAKDIDSELKHAANALTIFGCKVKQISSYNLPEDESIERKLILIEKQKITPSKYPRKSGIPKKSPL